MAKLAISIRLEKTKPKDSASGEVLDLESCLPWDQIADEVFQTTFKPYFMNQEVVVSFVEPNEIKRLNHMYRNLDEVTDVLSFNAIGNLTTDLLKFEDLVENAEIDPDDASIGDVIICIEKAIVQAKARNHNLKDELAFLFVHGLLHLLGYDHETADEAKEMYRLQDKILQAANLQTALA